MGIDIFTKDVKVAKKHLNEQLLRLCGRSSDIRTDDSQLVVQVFVDTEVAEGMKSYVLDELELGRLWDCSKNIDGKVPTFRMYQKEMSPKKN